MMVPIMTLAVMMMMMMTTSMVDNVNIVRVLVRNPFGDSLRLSDWLRAKHSHLNGYHVYFLYFDWLP